jgi:hypothetical protein
MQQLKDSLCIYAGRVLESSRFIRVIVSGSDREGEGEYKIFEYLSNLHLHDPNLIATSKREKCLIVGKYVIEDCVVNQHIRLQ